MALIGSLTSGVSSMQSFVKGMEVIGDNIANSKTVAFKRQRTAFTENFSQTLRDALPSTEGGSNLAPIQVGTGVALASTQKIFGQGSVELTGVASDLAISGDGFFRVYNSESDQSFLTRDGSFRVNEEGFFTDKNGNFLLGAVGGTPNSAPDTLGRVQIGLDSPAVRVDSSNRPIDDLSRLVLADGTRALPATESSSGFFRVDSEGRLLDSTDETAGGGVDFATIEAIILRDQIGGADARAALHSDGNYYLVDEEGFYIESDGTRIQDGGPADILFDPSVAAPTTAGGDTADASVWNALTNPFAVVTDGASADADAIYDPATSTLAVATPDEADPNQFLLSIQNWTINQEGDLRLSLNDGSSFIRGTVMLQNVQDADALVEEGSGLYSGVENAGPLGLSTWNIGRALTSTDLASHIANAGGLGFIQSRALEASNTDLTQEFADMITTQRAFQAGSKVINVSDEMLQEIINLKR